MGYLDSNFNANAAGTKGLYAAGEPWKIKDDVEKKEKNVAENGQKTEVSAETAMDFLGAQGVLNKALININPKMKSLSSLNEAEFSKAVESLINKYIDEDTIARITSSMDELATKFEESKNFALGEFPDLSEGAAEMLALAGVDAQA